jgi:hypothetical protein
MDTIRKEDKTSVSTDQGSKDKGGIQGASAVESVTRRGEEMIELDGKEAGRFDTGPKGATQRPTGKSTPRDMTGINPSTGDGPASHAKDGGTGIASITRRGEEMTAKDGKEAGRYDTEPKGATQRPTGKSTPRDMTGINPATGGKPGPKSS